MLKLVRKPHPEPNIEAFKSKNNCTVYGLYSEVDTQYFSRARGAIFQVLNTLNKKNRNKVLLPAFHCVAVVQPIVKAGFTPVFYGVDENLNTNIEDFLNHLDADVAAVIVINYFGFESDISQIKKYCTENNTLLIEDCSHSFMKINPIRPVGERGDVSVYSFWKVTPSITGAAIRYNRNFSRIEENYLTHVPFVEELRVLKNFVDSCFSFKSVKKNKLTEPKPFDVDRNERKDPAEELASYPEIDWYYSAKMSFFSRVALSYLDLPNIAEKVRKNYLYMNENIDTLKSCSPLFNVLSDEVVPWTYPLLLSDRRNYDYKILREGGSFFTFGEKLWPGMKAGTNASSDAYDVAYYFSNKLLCLSIHQQIERSDIDGILSIMRRLNL